MKLKNIVFKIVSVASLILFYVVSVLGVLAIIGETVTVFLPDSAFAKSFGFEPEYLNLDINFDQDPALYSDQAFRFLNLFTDATLFLFVALVFWYIHKLFRNVYKNNVFMYDNASVIFRLGLVFLVIGSGNSFVNGILESRAVEELVINNAKIGIVHVSFVDFFIMGIVLMAASVSLKKAVEAVEENQDTI